MSQLKIVFLGTSGSWPTPERNVSSVALKRDGEVILFDCGEGTQRQLMCSSLSFMQVDKVFISHFHGDHFLGLPGLIQSMTLNDREKELLIFGPAGLKGLVNTIMGLGYFNASFRVIAREMRDHETLDFGEYTITSYPADHSVPGLGFVFQEAERTGRFNKEKALEMGIPEGPMFSKLQKGQIVKMNDKTFTPDMVIGPKRPGRKIVYTGDSRPTGTLVQKAKDCDVIIHDGTFAPDMEEKAIEYGHSTTLNAAKAAKKARAKTLILTHISPRYSENEETDLIKDVKQVFPSTIVARDFMEFEVSYRE